MISTPQHVNTGYSNDIVIIKKTDFKFSEWHNFTGMLLLAPGSYWDASDVHLRKDPPCFQHLLLSNQRSSRECSLYEPLSSVDQLEVSLVCCFLVPLKFRPMTDGWMEKQWQTRALGRGRRKQLELAAICRK